MKRTKDIHMEMAEEWWNTGQHQITGWMPLHKFRIRKSDEDNNK